MIANLVIYSAACAAGLLLANIYLLRDDVWARFWGVFGFMLLAGPVFLGQSSWFLIGVPVSGYMLWRRKARQDR